MNLKTAGLLLIILSALTAGILQSHSKALVSKSAGHVISRTTSKAPDGSAVYSTSLVGTSTVYHWNIIAPLGSVLVAGVLCLALARERK